MDPWLDGVRRVLSRTPSCALSLSTLRQELRHEGLGPVPDPERLLTGISGRTDLFRILHLKRGPWPVSRLHQGKAGVGARSDGGRGDPWVLLLGQPDFGMESARSPKERIRVGLVEWGKSLDEGSPASLARWLRASLEGGRASTALATGVPRPT